MFKYALLSSIVILGLAACNAADKTESDVTVPPPNQIKIAATPTVYSFSTAVAESFGSNTSYKTPIVETTDSINGFKLFCSGLGENYPDIINISRKMKASEITHCTRNNLNEIIQIKIGYNGIVLASSRNSKRMGVTPRDVFLALAKDIPDGKGGAKPNDNNLWSDVNRNLPDRKIQIMGPSLKSATRNIFVERVMEKGCKTFASLQSLMKSDNNSFKARCHTIRLDKNFIETGDDENLIMQQLNENSDALAIVSFGFLDQNSDSIQSNLIDGTEATYESILDRSYPLSNSLYIYVKRDTTSIVPGIEEFLQEFVSDYASGQAGYLVDKGLIPMSPTERQKSKAIIAALNP